jgi:thioredoxin 1
VRVVYYFTADWCSPCKKTRPIVEEMNRETHIKFQIIDVDSELDLAKNFAIYSVPTFILLEDGIEIKRNIGAQNREQLEALINYEKNIQNDIQS